MPSAALRPIDGIQCEYTSSVNWTDGWPSDFLAMVGVSAFQVDEVARLFALDGGGREEARGIVRTHGMSARHAALMCGGALQRTHEVRELQNAYDRSEDHP